MNVLARRVDVNVIVLVCEDPKEDRIFWSHKIHAILSTS